MKWELQEYHSKEGGFVLRNEYRTFMTELQIDDLIAIKNEIESRLKDNTTDMKTVELLQCNECGAREWSILDTDSKISHAGDGCMHCDKGVYLFSRKFDVIL